MKDCFKVIGYYICEINDTPGWLSGKQKTYFKQICARESNMKVRMKLIKMLARFHVPGMAKELEKLWEYGAYAEAVKTLD